MSLGNSYLETLEKQSKTTATTVGSGYLETLERQTRDMALGSESPTMVTTALPASVMPVTTPKTVCKPQAEFTEVSSESVAPLKVQSSIGAVSSSHVDKVTFEPLVQNGEVSNGKDATMDMTLDVQAGARATEPTRPREAPKASPASESPVTTIPLNSKTIVDQNGQDDQEVNMSEAQKLMKQVKDAGTAGIISYALWELGFWLLSVPVVLFGYVQFTGHLPDFSNSDDVSKLGAGKFIVVDGQRKPNRDTHALLRNVSIQKNRQKPLHLLTWHALQSLSV